MKDRKSNKKTGEQFEKQVRKSIMSGGLPTDPGDLSTKHFIVECKYTDKNSFRITNKTIEKLWNQSLDMQKTPKLVIGLPHSTDDSKLFLLTCYITIEKKG